MQTAPILRSSRSTALGEVATSNARRLTSARVHVDLGGQRTGRAVFLTLDEWLAVMSRASLAEILRLGELVAQRTMVIITDDIDGTEGAETVTFGLDGAQFEIDLAQK